MRYYMRTVRDMNTNESKTDNITALLFSSMCIEGHVKQAMSNKAL